MSSFVKSGATPMGPRKPTMARPNPIRAMREREERRASAAAAGNAPSSSSSSASQSATPVRPSGSQSHSLRRQAATKNAAAALANPAKPQCPNKACPKPNVVDGTCQTCGRVADDSNIVAEVQFGETSSGAAMVQGSFVGADQAGVRSMVPSFRRIGGTEDREKSIREAKGLMQGYAQQLQVTDHLVTAGTQVFKLASAANFIQGRTIHSVAAVCLYAACRAQPPCKVMLIDLADLVQMNVFKLGRIFKKLNEVVPIGNDGLIPVYPEDLIWRFATKMEFHQDTAKVAEDAVRLVKRMSRDWMVMGRRPSGICGACLLMAARMHNYRRTVREIVYIVKVTNHTIQNRLSEFKITESSRMSVEDFLKQDFLESSHDPPSFYRKQEEWAQKQEEKGRKRRRPRSEDLEDEAAAAEPEGSDLAAAVEQSRRRGSARRYSEAGADLSAAPALTYRRDADGFIIPPHPSQLPADETEQTADGGESLDKLAKEFGDQIDAGVDDTTTAAGKAKKGGGPQLDIDEAWEQDEEELEGQIEEIFNDPLTNEHVKAYTTAETRARIHSTWALSQRPLKTVSMETEIKEDEFADDPEVANCLLSPAEAKIKETIWVNQNKEWLRQHQEKVFRRKVEAERPKQKRKRRKQARMGEGQTSPASSAAEAAISVAKDRAWSKRINYDAIRSIFDIPSAAGPGSAATSRKTSLAGSVLGGDDDGDAAPEESEAGGDAAADDDETFGEEDETQQPFGGDVGGEEEEFGGSGEFEGEYDEDNPDMDEEYGLEGHGYDEE